MNDQTNHSYNFFTNLQLGATISLRQLDYLDLSWRPALETFRKLKLKWLRLPIYWDDVQPKPELFDLTQILKIIGWCQHYGIKVIPTLGIKAPRWPEFHWPKWVNIKEPKDKQTQNIFIRYLTTVVNQLKKHNCIQFWQVENEPLDPSGPNQSIIDSDFLDREIKLVKKLDRRSIMSTVWGNASVKRQTFKKIAPLADYVGIDLYFKQFLFKKLGLAVYTGPQDKLEKIKQTAEKSGKMVVITELQAEPWEQSAADYQSENPNSISAEQLKSNFKHALKLQPKMILFWGFEYWLWRQQQGDESYLETVAQLIEKN